MQTCLRLAALCFLLSLGACGGGSGSGAGGAVVLETKADALRELTLLNSEVSGFMDEATDIGSPGGGGPGVPPRNDDRLYFASEVQPRLDACRSCHVPGGAADIDGGRLFMLVPDRAPDYDLFREAWEQLGRGVEESPILRYASGAQTPHTGGAPWPAGSSAYERVRRLLACWATDTGCELKDFRAVSTKSAKAARSCGSGSSVEQDELAPYGYVFFNRTVETDTQRRTDTRCTITGSASQEMFNGISEFGSTATTADGARFAYRRDGGNGGVYEQTYAEFDNGRQVYSQTERFAGSVEARDTDEALELRAVYRLEYEDSEGFFADVAIGNPGAPFRIISDETGLHLNGEYGYGTRECRGGAVTVVTQEGLNRDGEGGFNAGRLRLTSGSRDAVFRFSSNGSATVELKGSPVVIPAAEVRAALAESPCD